MGNSRHGKKLYAFQICGTFVGLAGAHSLAEAKTAVLNANISELEGELTHIEVGPNFCFECEHACKAKSDKMVGCTWWDRHGDHNAMGDAVQFGVATGWVHLSLRPGDECDPKTMTATQGLLTSGVPVVFSLDSCEHFEPRR